MTGALVAGGWVAGGSVAATVVGATVIGIVVLATTLCLALTVVGVFATVESTEGFDLDSTADFADEPHPVSARSANAETMARERQ